MGKGGEQERQGGRRRDGEGGGAGERGRKEACAKCFSGLVSALRLLAQATCSGYLLRLAPPMLEPQSNLLNYSH